MKYDFQKEKTMGKSKPIYIMGKSYDEIENGDDLNDIISCISTDIQTLLDKVHYSYGDDRSIWMVADGGESLWCIPLAYGCSISLKDFDPRFIKSFDDEDIQYAEKCIAEWRKKQDDFYDELYKRKTEKELERQEERDRKEYERLKAKYEVTK